MRLCKRNVPLAARVSAAEEPRGDAWFRGQGVLCNDDEDFCCLLIMVADGLWYHRNMQVFDASHVEGIVMVAAVVAKLRSYRDAQGWRPNFCSDLMQDSLLRPTDKSDRIYLEAGLGENGEGLGAVVFDPDANLTRTVAIRVRYSPGPVYLAERLAMEEALPTAADLQLPTASVMGDALQVILMVQGQAVCKITCVDTIYTGYVIV